MFLQSEDDGDGGMRRKKGLKEKIKDKMQPCRVRVCGCSHVATQILSPKIIVFPPCTRLKALVSKSRFAVGSSGGVIGCRRVFWRCYRSHSSGGVIGVTRRGQNAPASGLVCPPVFSQMRKLLG
ncbi:hypothetical protein SAY87_005730 [Trapa incisa]|uniref:Uncharacterized protein n=1 Tax=Trapa incisa TaxID=236973 RepID=A0AAN7KBG9_9MYRT|nr:hypothetical protein SAY87_005730 [Trapa incisa]